VLITEDDARGVGSFFQQFSEKGPSDFQGYLQLYITNILRSVWLLGLLGFGVFVGRKLGDPFAELDSAAD
jgi:hypothetical protein